MSIKEGAARESEAFFFQGVSWRHPQICQFWNRRSGGKGFEFHWLGLIVSLNIHKVQGRQNVNEMFMRLREVWVAFTVNYVGWLSPQGQRWLSFAGIFSDFHDDNQSNFSDPNADGWAT
jgi:hypothetical protein